MSDGQVVKDRRCPKGFNEGVMGLGVSGIFGFLIAESGSLIPTQMAYPGMEISPELKVAGDGSVGRAPGFWPFV